MVRFWYSDVVIGIYELDKTGKMKNWSDSIQLTDRGNSSKASKSQKRNKKLLPKGGNSVRHRSEKLGESTQTLNFDTFKPTQKESNLLYSSNGDKRNSKVITKNINLMPVINKIAENPLRYSLDTHKLPVKIFDLNPKENFRHRKSNAPDKILIDNFWFDYETPRFENKENFNTNKQIK